MLLVNAVKGPSIIHGFGLICQEFIPKGAVVWKFQPGFDLMISESVFNLLSPTAKEQVLYYGYHDVPANQYILSSDDDRFTNHSDEPNTINLGAFCTVAQRDIHPGEEITWAYGKAWHTTGRIEWAGDDRVSTACSMSAESVHGGHST